MRRLAFSLLGLCLLLSSVAAWAIDRGAAPWTEEAYLGLGSMNDLLGAQIEIANPVGSLYLLVGGHVSELWLDRWAEGRAAGFVAGIRLFSASRGGHSGWYVTGFGGTLGVERRREGGARVGYQRLGLGGGLGYQHSTARTRFGFTLGVARLQGLDTASGERIDREFLPVVETTLGLRF